MIRTAERASGRLNVRVKLRTESQRLEGQIEKLDDRIARREQAPGMLEDIRNELAIRARPGCRPFARIARVFNWLNGNTRDQRHMRLSHRTKASLEEQQHELKKLEGQIPELRLKRAELILNAVHTLIAEADIQGKTIDAHGYDPEAFKAAITALTEADRFVIQNGNVNFDGMKADLEEIVEIIRSSQELCAIRDGGDSATNAVLFELGLGEGSDDLGDLREMARHAADFIPVVSLVNGLTGVGSSAAGLANIDGLQEKLTAFRDEYGVDLGIDAQAIRDRTTNDMAQDVASLIAGRLAARTLWGLLSDGESDNGAALGDAASKLQGFSDQHLAAHDAKLKAAFDAKQQAIATIETSLDAAEKLVKSFKRRLTIFGRAIPSPDFPEQLDTGAGAQDTYFSNTLNKIERLISRARDTIRENQGVQAELARQAGLQVRETDPATGTGPALIIPPRPARVAATPA